MILNFALEDRSDSKIDREERKRGKSERLVHTQHLRVHSDKAGSSVSSPMCRRVAALGLLRGANARSFRVLFDRSATKLVKAKDHASLLEHLYRSLTV